MPPATVSALFNPRNVVLVGASDRPGHWSPRVWDNLCRHGFKGGVYAVNPGRREIFGARCAPDLGALPEPPDHLAIFVPADTTLEILEAGAKLGVRSATLYAAGFGEGGDADGQARAIRLRSLLRDTGIAAAGPNCMGLACGRSGFVTMADETLQPLSTGPIAVLTQSGMLATTFARALGDRDLGVSHLVSCGNQLGLTLADYVEHLAGDDGVKVITGYVEMIPEAPRFLAACAKARANGKSVVLVKIGGSDGARKAALAHTGAMTGSHDAFDAIARAAGVVRVDSLEEAIEAAELLSRGVPLNGPRIACMTNSGALKTLMTEAAERHGVQLAQLSPATQAAIQTALGADAEATNPLDTKRTLPTNSYMACVDALGASGDADLVVMLEELPREGGIARKIQNLEALNTWAAGHGVGRAPVAMLSPLALTDTAYMRELRGQLAHLPMLRGLDTTFRMLARLAPLHGALRSRTADEHVEPTAVTAVIAKAGALQKASALSEPESKLLLASYGIRIPREEIVADAEGAASASARIGFPVVLKAISSEVAHKSDAGLVQLGLTDDKSVREAADTITQRCASIGVPREGLLVAEHVKGGVEMVLGLHRDPEMGAVLMVGLGGVWLEVIRDVAFTSIDVNREEALAAIARTNASQILAGFRGTSPRDVLALADAMVALGRLAGDLSSALQSVDINPIVVLDDGKGAIALDALVVLQPPEIGGP